MIGMDYFAHRFTVGCVAGMGGRYYCNKNARVDELLVSGVIAGQIAGSSVISIPIFTAMGLVKLLDKN
jgi:hypothetical protein